jgi:hypothetical protein
VKRLVFQSPAGRLAISFLFIFTIKLNCLRAQEFPQILISNEFEPEEVSIAISPQNPAVMVAGSNLDRVYTSNDSGRTWQNNQLISKYGVYGDPCIVAGGANRFYYFHLSNYKKGTWIDRIVCQRSDDGGKTWNKGSYTGLNGVKNQDKHWVFLLPGKKNDTLYVAWTQFDKYNSAAVGDSSAIMFSASYDNGKNFSQPLKISYYKGDCLDGDNTVEGAVPAVHPDGTLLVAWAGPKGLVFNRSNDKGKTFENQERLICAMPGGWDISVKGLFRANGLPVLVCDRSNGPFSGRFYACWAEDRSIENNPDIWICHSDDKGNSWSRPSKINRDNSSAAQFMPWVCVSEETGKVYVIYYDRRESGTTEETAIWMGCSNDGGQNFSERKISRGSFLPDSKVFFGDYLNITCSKGLVRPIWMEANGEKLSIHTLLMNEGDIP